MELRFPVELQGQVAVFLLVLARVGGLFAVTPFFTGPAIPRRLKTLLAGSIALSMAPALAPQWQTALLALSTPGSAILAVATELGLGITIGFFVAIVIATIQTGGHFIAQEMGMTVASSIDPLTSVQSTILSQMMSSFAILMFILMDFHHHLLRLIAQSFRALPLGFSVSGVASTWADTLRTIAGVQGAELFRNAAVLAIPFTVILLLVTVAMGFLARAAPEMNVFVLGFILRIIIGLGVLIVLLPVVADVFEDYLHVALNNGAKFVRSLAGAL